VFELGRIVSWRAIARWILFDFLNKNAEVYVSRDPVLRILKVFFNFSDSWQKDFITGDLCLQSGDLMLAGLTFLVNVALFPSSTMINWKAFAHEHFKHT